MAKFMIDNACCKEDDTGGQTGQDCLDTWKEKLDEVCNEYGIAEAETSKAWEEYTSSQGWQAKLKNWDDIIKKADEKAAEVVTQLDFFMGQVKIVCENAGYTVEVFEKLICLVKSIFDCLHTYEQNQPGLREMIEDFKKEVECLKNLDDEDKAEVIKCIEAYEQKVTEVYEMQDNILSKLLEILKCANLLYAYICKAGGLEDKLEGISEDFKGKPEDEEHCHNGDDDDNGSSPDKYPCDDKEAKPRPKFPISESDYYKEIEEALEKAVEKTKELEDKWKEKKKKSDCILSNKKSLLEAIKAAEEAESGK